MQRGIKYPPIEFVVACNNAPSPEKELDLAIKVGLDEIHKPLSYAVGNDIPVTASYEEGKVKMSVGDLDTPSFVGLEQLVVYKSIKIG